MTIFADCSKELGPGTITIGTVLSWSWGFWDSRPDAAIRRSLNFEDFSKELGPGTITIGTVLFWSWGFWDYRPDSVILRSKSDTSKF